MQGKWSLALAPTLMGLFFFLAGLAFIPLAGLQNDELYFSGPIFYPETAFYRITVGSVHVPLMVISYTGALKTWLYAGLFQILEPNVWSVRVPVLLLGVMTIWLTWVWTRRMAGTVAALIATALLASDTIFLLTDLFDWGPVALQHVLLLGGLVALQRWVATESRKALGLGFFLWGLGLWDKALLTWPLIGLAVACLVVYPRELFQRIRVRAAVIAIPAFLLGALPLIVYNLERGGETATANAKLTLSELPAKMAALRQSTNGSSMFEFLIHADSPSERRAPRNALERAAVRIAAFSHPRRTNFMWHAWIAGLLCLVALWRTALRRPLLFLLVATAVAWFQMAITRGAGQAAHHVILLWPFPSVFLGIAFSGVAHRFRRIGMTLVVACVAFLVAGNVLTTVAYFSQFALHGATVAWTDAIYPLSDSLDEKKQAWIGLVDWGYLNPLALLHNGRLRLFVVNPDLEPAALETILRSRDYLFIQHTADKQLFPGINERFRAVAERQGYSQRLERTVADSHGRPVFEVFRFYRSH